MLVSLLSPFRRSQPPFHGARCSGRRSQRQHRRSRESRCHGRDHRIRAGCSSLWSASSDHWENGADRARANDLAYTKRSSAHGCGAIACSRAPSAAVARDPSASSTTNAGDTAASKSIMWCRSVLSRPKTRCSPPSPTCSRNIAMLLGNYRPMVQKADLGAKGVWYRLRIGPIFDKDTATKLCGQLKARGHPDCLVMAAQ